MLLQQCFVDESDATHVAAAFYTIKRIDLIDRPRQRTSPVSSTRLFTAIAPAARSIRTDDSECLGLEQEIKKVFTLTPNIGFYTFRFSGHFSLRLFPFFSFHTA
jgi:hypothetical protein